MIKQLLFIALLFVSFASKSQVLQKYYKLTPEQNLEYQNLGKLPFDSLLIGLEKNIQLYTDSATLKYLFLSNSYISCLNWYKRPIDVSVFTKLRDLARRGNDTTNVAYVENYKCEGMYYYYQGYPEKSIEHLKKAYQIIKQPYIRGPHNKMDLPYTIAHVCKSIDDLEGLFEYSQICIQESRKKQVPYYEVICLMTLCKPIRPSDPDFAIEIAKQSLNLAYQNSINQIPALYHNLYLFLLQTSIEVKRDYKAALVYADSCRKYSNNNLYPVVASALIDIEGFKAIANYRLDNMENANLCIQQVDSLLKDKDLMAQTDYFIYLAKAGTFLQQVNQNEKAYAYYQKSIDLYKSTGLSLDGDNMMKIYSSMTENLIELKDTVRFDKFFKQIAPLYTQNKPLDYLIDSTNYIVSENLNQHYISGLKSLSERTLAPTKIDSMLTLYESIYKLSTSIFTRFDYNSNTVFQHTVKLKSCTNVFVDNGIVQRMSPQQLKRFWIISSAVKSFDLVKKIQAKQYSHADDMHFRKLKNRLYVIPQTDSLYNKYFDEYLTYGISQQIKRLSQKGDSYNAQTLLDSYRDVEKLLAQSGSNLMLDYYLTDSTLSFVAIKGQNLSFYSQPLSAKTSKGVTELNRDVKTQNLSANSFFGMVQEQLTSYLAETSQTEKVTIIADGELLNLPFELISYQSKPLISSFVVNYNYSPYLAYLSQQNTTGKYNRLLTIAPLFESENKLVAQNLRSDITLLGDDYTEEGIYRDALQLAPLPYTKSEVKAISKFFGSSKSVMLIGNSATEKNVRENIGTADVVHFATHGYSSTKTPELSRLVLSDYQTDSTRTENDAFLYMDEIYELPIKADLAVLSACKTGTGKIVEGEGVMALPRGFIYAGVPNVIASLWKVHDEKTKELMVAFYKHLLEDKVSYAEALRRAKLDCITKGFSPMDWAGFILIGG